MSSDPKSAESNRRNLDKQLTKLIVVKGYRHTGKTTVARAVARWLRGTMLHLDDILNQLWPNESNSNPPSEEIAIGRYDVAMNLLYQIIRAQMSLKAATHIVLDCSLPSSQSHPKWLIQMLERSKESCHVLIIECKRRNQKLWRMSYEKRTPVTDMNNWHKPRSWDDIMKEIITSDDDENVPITLGLCCDGLLHVSKLVLDPYVDVPYYPDLLIHPPDDDNLSPFYKAIQYLLSSNLEEKSQLEVDLGQWAEISKAITNKYDEGRCRKYGHDVSNYYHGSVLPNKLLSHCSACGEAILKDPVYSCQYCWTISLHKHCAELNKDLFTALKILYDHNIYKLYFEFPEYHNCEPCNAEGRDFSRDCPTCLFQTHIKCRLWPTIIHHKAHHPHFLSLILPTFYDRMFYDTVSFCAACGRVMFEHQMGYGCSMCNVRYHIDCLTLLPKKTIDHIGYKHPMKLMLPNMQDEEEEDFICHVCCKERNPLLWCYYCEECDYFTELDCIDFTNSRVCKKKL